MLVACWISRATGAHTDTQAHALCHAHTRTHTHTCPHTYGKKYVKMLFHGKNGLAKAPHCYLTRTLQVLQVLLNTWFLKHSVCSLCSTTWILNLKFRVFLTFMVASVHVRFVMDKMAQWQVSIIPSMFHVIFFYMLLLPERQRAQSLGIFQKSIIFRKSGSSG
jgi:hypothetical protein